MNVVTFAELSALPWLVHGFTARVPGLDVKVDRALALERLRQSHQEVLAQRGMSLETMRFAEQVHGAKVARATFANREISPNVDGLVTDEAGLGLGIYVADCCAIFLVDRRSKAIGLLHSGRKGTDANIAMEGETQLLEFSGGRPEDVIAALSPCIHGCCYDSDFCSQIEEQLRALRVGAVVRHPDCTGCRQDRYYSYRKEQGRTGRMLAFMMRIEDGPHP